VVVDEQPDGRILAVQYQGAHLLTTDHTAEKRQIGEIRGVRSGTRCLLSLWVSEMTNLGSFSQPWVDERGRFECW